MDKIEELLTRGVENIIPSRKELEAVLRSGKKLNVYLGIDPTATQIHLGHAVPLRKLQVFVELGHNVTFLIGDFTALIGDTSDKEGERPILTKGKIETNFQTYKQQAEKLLDFSKVTMGHNSDWLGKLTFEDIVKLCQHFSVGDFIGRELIKKRMEAGTHIRLDEMLYPVMQGYDSYFMDTDIQVGGTDQTFNMQAGRALQKDLRGKESFVLATGFLEGTDGRKMSKSWGNAVWLTDEPSEMYGKIMSLHDDLIVQYFTLATNTPSDKVGGIKRRSESGENPMVLKKELAFTIVNELHSQSAAQKAQEQFESTFQKGELGKIGIPEIKLPSIATSLATVFAEQGIVKSKSEAKQLIEQGAIEHDSQQVTEDETVRPGIYRIGKKRFIKFV